MAGWTNDADAMRAFDDLMQSCGGPLNHFLTTTMEHMDEGPNWVLMRLMGKFVHFYNGSREHSTETESFAFAMSMLAQDRELSLMFSTFGGMFGGGING